MVITHVNGRNRAASVLAGVPDIDRQLAFERIVSLLAPSGFTSWKGIEELATPFKPLTDLDAPWRELFKTKSPEKNSVKESEPESLFGTTSRPPKQKPKKEKTPEAAEKEQQAKEKVLKAWLKLVQENIDTHYGGVHHVLLAYQDDLERDAERAVAILTRVLGQGTSIVPIVLPPGVHGPVTEEYLQETGKWKRASERANIRAAQWAPLIQWIQEYRKEHPEVPIDGIMVLARDRYGTPARSEDVINKQVGRITLKRELGLTVQYLLPRTPASNDADEEFQMRVVNAWRDLAWKSLGKFNSVASQMLELHLTPPPSAILGIGILRLNSTKNRGNKYSFIPYAIELDTSAGTCTGSVLLSGDREATAFMPLASLVQTITKHGPSRLGGKNIDWTAPKKADRGSSHIWA